MQKFWAGGFLYNPDKHCVLLHQRDSNTKFNPNAWAFFGGLNEGAKTPVQCFGREIEEELGLKLETKDVITLYDYFNQEFQTPRYVFYALCHKNKSEFTLNEGADFDWVDLKRLDEYNITEKTERDLKYFINLIKNKE